MCRWCHPTFIPTDQITEPVARRTYADTDGQGIPRHPTDPALLHRLAVLLDIPAAATPASPHQSGTRTLTTGAQGPAALGDAGIGTTRSPKTATRPAATGPAA